MYTIPPAASLWVGNVSHSRLHPTHHAFRYPLHLMMVDTQKIEDKSLFSGWGCLAGTQWWCAVSLRREDHLQGVGVDHLPLDAAIRTIVRRTLGRDDVAHGPVRLLTHPRYFGYCFNPAAFFYLYKEPEAGMEPELECIVVQVTNTPWGEMHCYVLHPDAPGVRQLDAGAVEEGSVVRFAWPKVFHVSPFMPMRHEYDWTFHTPRVSSGPVSPALIMGSKQTRVSAGAHPAPAPQPPGKISDDSEDDGSGAAVGMAVLTTAMRLEHTPLTAAHLLWRLLVLPWLTVLVQVWIHVEALRLVGKGVPLFEHPTGAQTTLTRVVEVLATPVVWLLTKPPKETKTG